jgi:tryptophan 7-halogenase
MPHNDIEILKGAGEVHVWSAKGVIAIRGMDPATIQQLHEDPTWVPPDVEPEFLSTVRQALLQVTSPPAGPSPLKGAVGLLASDQVRDFLSDAFQSALPGVRLGGGDAPCDLLLVLSDGQSMEELIVRQRATLEACCPSIFCWSLPDGIRVGPITVPGSSACLQCLLRAESELLGLNWSSLEQGLGNLRTRPFRRAEIPAAKLIQLTEAVLAGALTAEDLSHLHVSRRRSHGSAYSVLRDSGCDLCRAIEPASALQTRSLVAVSGLGPQPSMVRPLEKRILVLGAGTAGQLAALALRKRFPQFHISMVSSESIPPIGVGESTTPLIVNFLHRDLEIPFADFYRAVQPTIKYGLKFDWGPESRQGFSYPFGPSHPVECYHYQRHTRFSSLFSLLISEDRFMPEFCPGSTAYHLENRSLLAFLGQRTSRDVDVVNGRVDAIVRQGDTVTAVQLDDGRRIECDFLVDCSGTSSLVMGKELGSRWVGYEHCLFTDSALTVSLPRGGMDVSPYTRCTAMEAGWTWSIPLHGADHHGYVFSSRFCSPEQAREALARKLPNGVEARLLNFAPGRRADFLRGNVAALGNAYGFVEPLEATAIHMVITQLAYLVDYLGQVDPQAGDSLWLNRRVADQWDHIAWFLAIHFCFNQWMDTPFWRACREETKLRPVGFDCLDAYERGGPLTQQSTLSRHLKLPDNLWGLHGIDSILLGQGHSPVSWKSPVDLEVWFATKRRWLDCLSASLSAREFYERLESRQGAAQFGQHLPRLNSVVGPR